MSGSPEGLDRAIVCLAAPEEVIEDSERFSESLDGVEMAWFVFPEDEADGPPEIVATIPLADAMRTPRYGTDRRCAELPTVDLAFDVGPLAPCMAPPRTVAWVRPFERGPPRVDRRTQLRACTVLLI